MNIITAYFDLILMYSLCAHLSRQVVYAFLTCKIRTGEITAETHQCF